MTDYHIKYYSHELTKKSSANDYEKLTNTLIDARVDHNPHQIDAALSILKEPLSMGMIEADEVGLGKTIVGGLVIFHNWFKDKRKILIIVPANLRKQWSQELMDKFDLPSVILDSANFPLLMKDGNLFDTDSIVICSYHFARNRSEYISNVEWDLVVLDEAHFLRNAYQDDKVIANTIKRVIRPHKKLLLTATPLQNSLLELYGLVSFIDEYAFGDLESFKSKYSKITKEEVYEELRERLKPFCYRTLRRQVTEYIRYTRRIPMTQEYVPYKDEQELYHLISMYLQRKSLYALPKGARMLIILIMRKLLSSSTFAIAGTLKSLIFRLEEMRSNPIAFGRKLINDFSRDYEGLSEDEDEWGIDDFSSKDWEGLEEEIYDLKKYYKLAVSITKNAKGDKLLTALSNGFKKIEKLGGERKAVIFTESKRTQKYLYDILSQSEYKEKIILFNGMNDDQKSKDVYQAWKEENQGTDKVSGSRSADMRAALVDYFREEAEIMIATEAAAEGINLQFCSFIVNFDMPWNPQRVEQRIGRCHRYGQKLDVVVLNFMNKANAADIRIYELLDQKFKLFNGVFGASDEILGSIESGIDFERRILEVYQTCRTAEEIEKAFDKLQDEIAGGVDRKIKKSEKKLFENHDDDEVKEKLRNAKIEIEESIATNKSRLLEISKRILRDHAVFEDDGFILNSVPENVDAYTGCYTLGNNGGHRYRINGSLAQHVISKGQNLSTPWALLKFNNTGESKIAELEKYQGKAGWINVRKVSVGSLHKRDHVFLSCFSDDGELIDEDLAKRFFSLDGEVIAPINNCNFSHYPDQIFSRPVGPFLRLY